MRTTTIMTNHMNRCLQAYVQSTFSFTCSNSILKDYPCVELDIFAGDKLDTGG